MVGAHRDHAPGPGRNAAKLISSDEAVFLHTFSSACALYCAKSILRE